MTNSNTKTNLIFAILLIIAIIFATIMLPSNINSITQTANAQAKQEVKNTPKKENKKPHCDADCKVKFLNEELKIDGEFAYEIVYVCKELAKDPVSCIKSASGIIKSESSGGYRCSNFNCLGINIKGLTFKSKHEAMTDWVKRYNRNWYNWTSYWNSGRYFY